ncbi:MAG: outer membrane beta-barrel protein, partial [Ignavibacteriota bacterium]
MNTSAENDGFRILHTLPKILALVIALGATLGVAQPNDSLTIKWNGYVDTYFMFDFNQLPNNVASHPFTQPRRHNEFNINLAHIEVDINSADIRGVLALHCGTAVQGNYAAEAAVYSLAPLIHQAWAGYRVASNLWIDAGVYPAPYGFESWISRDNKTYTRSIVADYSPYYQTGIRATWTPSELITVGVNVINGWQNMAETNNDKALGLTLGYTPSGTISFTYNNFIGNEMPTGTPAATRFYNNLCTRLTISNA